MSEVPPGPRSSTRLLVAGLALLLIAGILGAGVLVSRNDDSPGDGTVDAIAACRAFERVHDATRPGAPVDANALARTLESAIDGMRRAADGAARFASLADDLEAVGDAVNAGDALRAAEAMGDAHAGCTPLLEGADEA